MTGAAVTGTRLFKRYQQVHFVGIGGAGMSGLAEVILTLGFRVTGSDARRSEAVEDVAAIRAPQAGRDLALALDSRLQYLAFRELKAAVEQNKAKAGGLVIVDVATEMGITRRHIDDEEILQRLLYPMVNEGAKILEEKIAIRASDIDVIWVYGYGWPVYRGGPMFWADQIGLRAVRDRMLEFQKATGDAFWTPAPLLNRLADQGKGFIS